MREKEGRVETYLRQRVRQAGGLCLKLDSAKGLPDRLVVLPDRPPFFVEVKAADGRLSRIQEHVIRRLRDMGQRVHVVYSKGDVDRVLEP